MAALCMLLALALVPTSRAQAGTFFAELPPALAPLAEVSAAAPSPLEVPAAAPTEIPVQPTAPTPAAAPTSAAGPAAGPAATSLPSLPVEFMEIDLSNAPFSSIQVQLSANRLDK